MNAVFLRITTEYKSAQNTVQQVRNIKLRATGTNLLADQHCLVSTHGFRPNAQLSSLVIAFQRFQPLS